MRVVSHQKLIKEICRMSKELEAIIDYCKLKIEEIESFIDDNNLMNVEKIVFNNRLETYMEVIDKANSLMDDFR